MNQRLAANRYRRFPFVQDAVLPFPDRFLVDLRLVLSQRFGEFTVTLAELGNTAGFCELWFTINSTDLPGYGLWVGFMDTEGQDSRVLLTLQTIGGTPHPELGYGVAFIGDAVAVPAPTVGLSILVDPACLRLHANGQPMVLRVANMFRPGQSSCTETQTSTSTLSIMGRVAETVTDCIEVTTAPSALQTEVIPTLTGAQTDDVAIPSPAGTHTRYQDGVVTLITTHDATIDDAIPTAPAWAAEVNGAGPVVAEPVLAAGHNLRLTGSVADNAVTLGYRLGAGSGVDCTTVKGYPALGRLSVECVKSINGAHGPELELDVGNGLSLLTDPSSHRLLLLVNAGDLGRASA